MSCFTSCQTSYDLSSWQIRNCLENLVFGWRYSIVTNKISVNLEVEVKKDGNFIKYIKVF